MNKSLLLACIVLMLTQTSALAENWIGSGETQYDTDSVYIGSSSGFLYFTLCMQDKCVAGDDVQMIMYMRYDCDTGMESNMEAFSDNWTQPVAHTGDLESKLCAQRASLPRHQ
ncbi:MAG TPA: hypothetical protein VHZ78_03955 [Rhizomicrobium sp.]|jgi:hypothetical protein|nr:hypothetical protein [Rhizomicrobium sp.]